MEQEPEYAPRYSLRERLRHVLIGLACGAVIVAVCNHWAFPALRAFAQTAHCRTVLGLPGPVVLMYGVFVGLPLAAALSIAAFVVPMAIRAIRTQQFPPPGMKVSRSIKVRRGRAAKLSAIHQLMLPVILACIAIWGIFQAAKLTSSLQAPSSYPECKIYLEAARLEAAASHT